MSTEQDTTIEHADEVVDAKPKGEVSVLDPLERCRAGLAELETEHGKLVALAKPDDDAERKFRLMCVKLRSGLDDAYEVVNRPLLATQRDARKLRDELKTAVTRFEDPIDARIRAREAEADRRRQARIEEERARRVALLERIGAIASVSRRAVGKSSADIEAKIKLVVAQEIGDDFGELKVDAERVRAETLTTLRELLEGALAAEAEAARVQAERERIARAAEFQTRLHDLRSRSIGMASRPHEAIAAAVDATEAIAIGPEWAEFAGQAAEAKQAVVDELKEMLAHALERQRVAQEQEAERARLAAAAEEQRRTADLQLIERERQRLAQSRLDFDRLAHAAAQAVARVGVDRTAAVYGYYDREKSGVHPADIDNCIAALDALQPLPEKNAQENGPSPADAPAPGDAPATCASSGAEAAQDPPSGAEGAAAHADGSAAEPAAGPAAAPVDDGRRINLGEICVRLGFTVDRGFVEGICNVPVVGTKGRGVLFRASDWPVLCDAIVAHVQEAKQRHGDHA
jgi:hypothetical protein